MSSPTITISTTAEDTSEKIVCKLCRRQFAQYTCPTCNVPYCSLTCFRSDAHSQCSEPFYKKELESGIRSEPSKTAGERTKMLELLKRFEEENVDDNFGSQEDDEEEDDLAKRFSSIDLESASPDALWSLLTQAEKDRFIKAVNDPSSELAQKLLSEEELHKHFADPWWTCLPIDRDTDNPSFPPTTMDIPEALLKPVPNRPLLAYNIAAVGIAYAFIVRHLGLPCLSTVSADDPDFGEAYKLIGQLLPFLSDRKSTLVFRDIDGVVTDIASRFDSQSRSPAMLAVLLEDAAKLVTPLEVVEITTAPSEAPSLDLLSHPHQIPLLLMSDLHSFFSRGMESRQIPNSMKHLTHKLVFYAAHMISMPTPLLRGLARELKEAADRHRAESDERNRSMGTRQVAR
ncbi:hypothetical protein BKA70DRAFT_1254575 [Coprinopsis sp. MPI-PUGE-AT-0042]|nr:hypothetical protein BKA70DRAFT_1254575 [Coprinopsis sp. MPI-PUGE-AT-0042]